MNFVLVGPATTPENRDVVIRNEIDGTYLVVHEETAEFLHCLSGGGIVLPTWAGSSVSRSFCETSVAKVVDGPDQPPRIRASDYEKLIGHVCGTNGVWHVPPMDGNEQWCLLHCHLLACTCAITVARVDGKQKGFRVRDYDVYEFLTCARMLSRDAQLLNTVIGHSICGPDEAEIEWKVYCPIREDYRGGQLDRGTCDSP